MRKNTKRLLAGALALVVLGGLYAVLMLHPKTDDSATVSTELVSLDATALASVKLSLQSGEMYTVSFSTTDSGTQYTMTGGEADADYSQTLMQELRDTAVSISGTIAEENCSDLSRYGVSADDTTDVVTITDTDGNVITLTIGLTNSSFGTYCVKNDETTVYLLDSDTLSSLTQPQSYYRNLTVLGGYYSLSSEVNALSMTLRDGTEVTIQKRDTSALTDDQSSAYTKYVLTAPISCDAEDTAVSEILSSLQNGLTANAIVADNPTDLRVYGLDDPFSIQLIGDNLDATVLVGDSTEDGNVYVMAKGGNTVFLTTASAFSFLEEDWNDWRSPILLQTATSELKSVSITQDGVTDTIVFTQIAADENAESDTATTTAAFEDGSSITEDAMEQLVNVLTSVKYTALTDDSTQNANAEIEVSVTTIDDATHKIALIKGGSREYLAAVDDGGYLYRVPQDTVTSLLNALENAKAETNE